MTAPGARPLARRVAVLADVHANPWALRAVLADVRAAAADLVVDAGDLLAGPWPTETAELLRGCGLPVVHVRGNGDRMVADAHDARPGWQLDVPAAARPTVAWAAARLRPAERRLAGAAPLSVRVDVAGLGPVVVCHATPRSDEEVVLETTPDAVAAEALRPLRSVGDTDRSGGGVPPPPPALVVSGHTHLPGDRLVGGLRWVGAGSVGKPFDAPSASWLLLAAEVEWRRTSYDVAAAAERGRAALLAEDHPDALVVAQDWAASLVPPGRGQVLELFTPIAAAQRGRWAVRSRRRVLD